MGCCVMLVVYAYGEECRPGGPWCVKKMRNYEEWQFEWLQVEVWPMKQRECECVEWGEGAVLVHEHLRKQQGALQGLEGSGWSVVNW